MDKGDNRLKDFLYRSDRPALLLDTSGGLSLGPLPGLEDLKLTVLAVL